MSACQCQQCCARDGEKHVTPRLLSTQSTHSVRWVKGTGRLCGLRIFPFASPLIDSVTAGGVVRMDAWNWSRSRRREGTAKSPQCCRPAEESALTTSESCHTDSLQKARAKVDSRCLLKSKNKPYTQEGVQSTAACVEEQCCSRLA